MNLTTVATGLSIVALLISIGSAVWGIFTKGNAAIAASIERIGNKQIEHDRRIQKVEDQIPHMPTAREVAELVAELRGVTEQLGAIQRDQHRQGESIERIEDVMMRERK